MSAASVQKRIVSDGALRRRAVYAGPKPRFRPARRRAPAARAASAEPSEDAGSTTTTGTPSGTDATAAVTCAEEFHETIATRTRGTLKRFDDRPLGNVA